MAIRKGKVATLIEFLDGTVAELQKLALFFAADVGNMEIIRRYSKLIMGNRDEVLEVLLKAIAEGQLEVAKYLMKESDAPEEFRYSIGQRKPLQLKKRKLEVVRELNLRLEVVMEYVVEGDDMEVAREVLKKHGRYSESVQYIKERGKPLIHRSAELGRVGIIAEMVKYGADINQRNNKHETPLMVLIDTKHHSMTVHILNVC